MNEEKRENAKNSKVAELEALLFVHGEPILVSKAAKILSVDEKDFPALLNEFQELLADEKRGLTLVDDGEKIQLATKPNYGAILGQFIREELSEDLTSASLETLSIIAYLGPISRSRLEYLRGVNSFFTLRSLMLRGLVERFQDPKKHNTYLYKPSFDLLRHMGLNKINDLPEFEKFRSVVQVFENAETNKNQ